MSCADDRWQQEQLEAEAWLCGELLTDGAFKPVPRVPTRDVIRDLADYKPDAP